MAEFEFQLRLSRALTGDEFDRAYENGFDNSLIGRSQQGGEIDVCWEATSREEAIKEALAALKEVAPDIDITLHDLVE